MNKFVKLLLLLVTCIFSASLTYAQSCMCEVSLNKEKDYDKLLELNSEAQTKSQTRDLPWGIPTSISNATHEHALYQEEWITWYDDDLRIPLWAAYQLKAQDVISRPRTDCFRKDPRLNNDVAAFCQDYDEPIFDRGHLVPRADMNRSEAAMINTFTFSNMTPQFHAFNTGIWERLETMVRNWAKTNKEIYVITGSIFDKNGDQKRDPDNEADLVEPRKKVSIPTHFYKIVVRKKQDGKLEAIALTLPHTKQAITSNQTKTYLTSKIVSIRDIEKVTGINFFPDLNQQEQDVLETSKAPRLW